MPENPGEVSKLTNSLRPDNNKSHLSPALVDPGLASLATKSGKRIWLPRKDLFSNQELEFGISLSDLKIAFENLGLSQPKPAFLTL